MVRQMLINALHNGFRCAGNQTYDFRISRSEGDSLGMILGQLDLYDSHFSMKRLHGMTCFRASLIDMIIKGFF